MLVYMISFPCQFICPLLMASSSVHWHFHRDRPYGALVFDLLSSIYAQLCACVTCSLTVKLVDVHIHCFCSSAAYSCALLNDRIL